MNISKITENISNAVSYERVSTSKQVDGESLESQKRLNTVFAEKDGSKIVKCFTEKGESAGSLNRPALQELIKFCCDKSNKISKIIVWRYDRLSRDMADFTNIISFFAKHKITVLSATENNAPSPEGRFIRNIAGSAAQYERDVNRMRTQAANEESVRSGRWIRKARGFDFKMVNGKKQLTPNKEAAFIKEVFELKALGVYTESAIRKIMKSKGFDIQPQALFIMLRNPVYCSLLPDKYNNNKGQLSKGIHEPIISEQLFWAVQNVINGKKPTAMPRLKNNPLFPLRGFVICPKCGKPMTASVSHGKKIKVPYYQCRRKGCPRYQKKILEPAYVDYLQSIQANPKVMKAFEKIVFDRFKERTAEMKSNNERISKIISDLGNQKLNTISLIAKGTVNDEDGKLAIRKINERIEEHKGYIEIEDETTPKFEEYWDFAKFFMGNISELWIDSDLDLRQRITGLTTPSGFIFRNKLVEPLKTPYFTRIFASKNTAFTQERAREESNL